MNDRDRGPASGYVVTALDDASGWRAAAVDLVARLGFSLVNSEHSTPGDSHLVVAIRDEPTLRHFDPESISYYAPTQNVARFVTLDPVAARTEGRRRVLWGHLHVTDRLRIENRFLTFGGQLRSTFVDPSTTILDLRSPAPIVRWGGHSQGCDGLAGEIGAFFGRLMVPVNFSPTVAARLTTAPPDVLYAAFLLDLGDRVRASERWSRIESPLEPWVVAQRARLVDVAPEAWVAGGELLEEVTIGFVRQRRANDSADAAAVRTHAW